MADSRKGVSRLPSDTDSDRGHNLGDYGQRQKKFRKAQQKPARVVDWPLIGSVGLSGLWYKAKSLLGYGPKQPVGGNRNALNKAHQRKIADLQGDPQLSVNVPSAEALGYEFSKIPVPIVKDGKFAGIEIDGKPSLGIHAVFSETPFGGHAFCVQGFERRSIAYPKLMRGDILLDALLVEGDVQVYNPPGFSRLHWPGQITNDQDLLEVSARLGQQIEHLVGDAKTQADENNVTKASILFDVARPKAGSGKALTLRTFSNFKEGHLECRSSF